MFIWGVFMLKRFVSFYFVFVMMISITSVAVFARNEKIYNGFFYKINDNEVTITGCDSSISGNIVIPEMIDGFYVTKIYGFAYNDSITSVVFPNSVTQIDGFSNCDNLVKVEFGENISIIGQDAFNGCHKLSDIEIPDSVTTIEHSAFAFCHSLKNVKIPEKVKSIGNKAFRCCNSLENIVVDEENEYYSSDEYGVLFNKSKTKLIQYPVGNIRTEYIIPDEVIEICEVSFDGAKNLENVIIGNNVTTVCAYAFYGCSKLKQVRIPENVTKIEMFAYLDCNEINKVSIGSGMTEIGESMLIDSVNIERINVDENNPNYSSDEYGVLYNKDKTKLIKYPPRDSRTEYSISDNVSMLSGKAFSNCDNLKKVVIGKGISTINNVFYHCDNLKEVVIPESVKNIDDYAVGYISNYNPDTDSINYKAVDGFIIYGNIGSVAEKYAKDNKITFVEINKEEQEIVLEPNNGIYEKNNVITIMPEVTIEYLESCIENDNIVFLSILGEQLVKKSLAGTGTKVQVLDRDGKVLSEYTVLVKSDVNGDAKITAADARIALRNSAKLEKLEGVFVTAADDNGDNKITAADARKILRKSAKLE